LGLADFFVLAILNSVSGRCRLYRPVADHNEMPDVDMLAPPLTVMRIAQGSIFNKRPAFRLSGADLTQSSAVG
jgi:hypothetical protein